jgi:hypothetical protein
MIFDFITVKKIPSLEFCSINLQKQTISKALFIYKFNVIVYEVNIDCCRRDKCCSFLGDVDSI